MTGLNMNFHLELKSIADQFFEGYRVDAANYIWKNPIMFDDEFVDFCFHYWLKYSDEPTEEEV